MTSKFILLLLIGAGAVLFFTTRAPEVKAPPSTVASVDQDALRQSRKRYYEKAIADLLQQKRRSPADDRKIQEMRQKLNAL